jgi:hypothetical protein
VTPVVRVACLAACGVVCAVLAVSAQRGGGPPGAGGPPVPRASAPIDLTGYWVSLITEDWRYRVTTPPKGDYSSVPLNPAGRKAADGWDPARDAAAGEQCRAYGVGGVLRMPGRLHITWTDDRTLKLEADAGSQERLLSFGPPVAAAVPGWQGTSRASWDRGEGPMGGALLFGGAARSSGASLKVVTTGMKPGYLRRNGVPYSADAVITEYFDRLDVPGGGTLLVVTIEVVDPVYLSQPFWTSVQFKRQADATGWRPAPCV